MSEKRLPRGAKSRNRPGISMEIPINIERVLLRAAMDRAFRDALLESSEEALRGTGFDLIASERAMLAAMPRSTLETMIDRLVPGRGRKGRFAKHVAAAVAGSMILTASTGCEVASAGITSDAPEFDPPADIRDTADEEDTDSPADVPVDTAFDPDVIEEPDVDDMVEGDLAEEDVTAGDAGDAEETDG